MSIDTVGWITAYGAPAGAMLDVVHAERSRIRMPGLAQTDLFLFDIQSQKPVAASTNLWFGKENWKTALKSTITVEYMMVHLFREDGVIEASMFPPDMCVAACSLPNF